ncbi:hypothetical protein VPH35_059199 [Triticum aestivum]|uniref:Uncharacterized protein n=1 Tax=Aegilops tauschii subsp. strangulata TaxID=200361 RepID=A0A453EJV7_AEGTS
MHGELSLTSEDGKVAYGWSNLLFKFSELFTLFLCRFYIQILLIILHPFFSSAVSILLKAPFVLYEPNLKIYTVIYCQYFPFSIPHGYSLLLARCMCFSYRNCMPSTIMSLLLACETCIRLYLWIKITLQTPTLKIQTGWHESLRNAASE